MEFFLVRTSRREGKGGRGYVRYKVRAGGWVAFRSACRYVRVVSTMDGGVVGSLGFKADLMLAIGASSIRKKILNTHHSPLNPNLNDNNHTHTHVLKYKTHKNHQPRI